MTVRATPLAQVIDPTNPEEVVDFWRRVDRRGTDDCWPWLTMHGWEGRRPLYRGVGAHRVAYLIAVGDPGDQWVRRTCNSRGCCNPAHLVLVNDVGTNGGDPMRVVPCRMHAHVADELTATAAAEGTTVSAILRAIVEDFLAGT